jgi:hypothetical protein
MTGIGCDEWRGRGIAEIDVIARHRRDRRGNILHHGDTEKIKE